MKARWIRNFFGFSRKETNGFIILLLIMVIVIFSEPVFRVWISSRTDDLSQNKAELDRLIAHWEPEQKEKKSIIQKKTDVPVNFLFDPNRVSDKELLRLGFSERLAARLIHYREKGGEFRIKSDLLKIYGIDSALYRQLYSYIELPVNIEQVKFIKPESEKSHIEKVKFDLNLADTAQLSGIYGIGSVLSSRIVQYRQRLGGFINSSQVVEIYGLDSMVINRLLKSSYLDQKFRPRQININTATESELDIHPYITRAIARVIVTYRFQHGKFNQVNDIRNLQLVKADIAEKIIPYLKVQDEVSIQVQATGDQ